ncbi:MAG: hypothetical protein AB8E82_15125 [Aureispira sp.]
MFSFFRKKPQRQEHPLFGPLVYRANRNKQAGLAGFWEGALDVGLANPTKLIIWGDAATHPHPQQEVLFEQLLDRMPQYVEESKTGLREHIQAEEQVVGEGIWNLNHLYFQAYPMSARLLQDLPATLHDGVAWGFAFDIEGLQLEGQRIQGYSALVNHNWHPTFPFTYY